MKKFTYFFILQILLMPFGLKANENFSVEIEALTLVMEQYKKDSKEDVELNNNKPTYMALKQDDCNAIVKVTEKTGLDVVNTESFDVNICKKEIYKVIN